LTDLSKIERGLTEFFSGVYGEDVAVGGVEEVSAGWEAKIIGFYLSAEGGERPMIARVFSGATASEKVEREFGLMLRLLRVGYPVPEVYAYSSSPEFLGEPFLAMERLRGSLLDHFTENTRQGRKSLSVFSQLYVGLHSLPARRILCATYGYRTTRGRLRHRIADVSRGLNDESQLAGIGEWLSKNLLNIQNTSLALIHQDFHPGNVMFKADRTPVVIDWSGADLGDPREDLGWTKLLASTFLSSELGDAVLSGYEEASGRRVEGLAYFEVLAGFRRLADATAMFRGESSGLRREVADIMRGNRAHYLRIIERLGELTGLETWRLADILE